MDSACAPHIISPHINSPTSRHPSRHVHLYWYVHTKTLTAHGRLSVCVHACMYMYIHIYPALRCALPGPSMRPALNAVDQRWSRPPVYAAMTFSASAEVEGAGAEGGRQRPWARLCLCPPSFACRASSGSSSSVCPPTSHLQRTAAILGPPACSQCVFAMRVRNVSSRTWHRAEQARGRERGADVHACK
jgi:hypothetical protein